MEKRQHNGNGASNKIPNSGKLKGGSLQKTIAFTKVNERDKRPKHVTVPGERHSKGSMPKKDEETLGIQEGYATGINLIVVPAMSRSKLIN